MKNTDFAKFCGPLVVGMENRQDVKVIAMETQKKLRVARDEKNRLQKKFAEFKAAAAKYEARADELMEATQMQPFADTQDFLHGSLGLDSESQDDGFSAGGGSSLGGSGGGGGGGGGGSSPDDGGSSPGGGSSFGSAAAEIPQPFVDDANRPVNRPANPPANNKRKRKNRWGPPTQAATNSFFGAKKN
jgi:hypothetical protein